MKRDNAFTGLEAAIVLIAFVVVAAVFSYVMLGAGFFATQRAQEVTYAGIQQATSNMYLVGSIYGTTKDPETTATLNFLEFKLGVPEGGQAQDMKDLRLLFSKRDGLPIDLKNNVVFTNATTPEAVTEDGWIFKKDDGGWSYFDTSGAQPVSTMVALEAEGTTPSVSRIQSGEKMSIRVLLGSTVGPAGGESFTLEIKPRIGASYLITKTLATGYTHGPLL